MFSVVSVCHSVKQRRKWGVPCHHYPWRIGGNFTSPLTWTWDITGQWPPTASDIWWQSIETCANLFTAGPLPRSVLPFGGYWSTNIRQTYHMQPTGMLSCLVLHLPKHLHVWIRLNLKIGVLTWSVHCKPSNSYLPQVSQYIIGFPLFTTQFCMYDDAKGMLRDVLASQGPVSNISVFLLLAINIFYYCRVYGISFTTHEENI